MPTKRLNCAQLRLEDLPPDRRLSLAEAAKLLPGNPAPSAIARWRRDGLLARDGEVVRLATTRISGRSLGVTVGALLAFFDRLEREEVSA